MACVVSHTLEAIFVVDADASPKRWGSARAPLSIFFLGLRVCHFHVNSCNACVNNNRAGQLFYNLPCVIALCSVTLYGNTCMLI